MLYEDILKDERLIKYLKSLDKEHNSPVGHGLNHALGVVHNVEALALLLNIDSETVNYLKIAAFLHDTGTVEGKEGHEMRGAKFALDYLKNKISDEWCEKIYHAIYHHHEKDNVANLSLFDHILLFADKSDVTKKRIDLDYYQDNNEFPFLSTIEDVSYQIQNKTFILTFNVNDKRDINAWDYYSKLNKRTREFASKLGLDNYEIRLVK